MSPNEEAWREHIERSAELAQRPHRQCNEHEKEIADLRTQLEGALNAAEFAAKRDMEQHEQIARLEAALENSTRAAMWNDDLAGQYKLSWEAAEKRETELLEALLWVAGNCEIELGDVAVCLVKPECASPDVNHDGTAEGFRAAILKAVADGQVATDG